MSFFDALETRTADERLDENLTALRVQVAGKNAFRLSREFVFGRG